MQRRFTTAVFLSTLFSVVPARAFVPQQSGVEEEDGRPSQQLVLKARSLMGSQSQEGAQTFLGNVKLPRPRFSPSSADAATQALVSYFAKATGSAGLQLKQISDSTQDGSGLVGFVQSVSNIPVQGTYALAEVQNGNLRYSRHFLVQPPSIDTQPRVDAAYAAQVAQSDVANFGQNPNVVGEPSLLIAYQKNQPILVWQVRVGTDGGTWNELINAATGTFAMRHKSSFDAVEGTVTAPVEPSCQGEQPQVTAMPYIQWTSGFATNGQGQFSGQRDYSQTQVQLNGAFFRINSQDGYRPVWSFPLAALPADNELSMDQAPLSQTDPYIYANQARSWVRGRAATVPSLTNARIWNWTNTQLPINVNMNSTCNAYYDGQSLNFFQAGNGCNNSGRANKIVFHEYGHGIHDHLTANSSTFDHQVSEGVADYVAASMTNDPNISGLMSCTAPLGGYNTLRTCVNKYTYCNSRKCNSYPGTHYGAEPHNAAPIICGALWELRGSMVARYGQDAGVLKADQLFLRFLTRVVDMNSSYTAAIAADEDDDNDPSNGTVHSCEINKAFLGEKDGDFAHFPDLVKQRVPCVAPEHSQ